MAGGSHRYGLVLAIVLVALGAALLAGCEATPAGSASSTAATTTSLSAATSSSPPPTLAEKLPPVIFEDVGYIELLRPGPEKVDAHERRILSPVADADDVRVLLEEYAKADVRADDVSSWGEYGLDLIIHLKDGGAYWARRGSDYPSWRVAHLEPGQSERDGYTWEKEIVAPGLTEAAVQAITKVMDASEGGALPADMPDDFAFIAGFGPYGKMVLDTFAGDFYRDMVAPTFITARTSLVLSRPELEEAYRGLVALDLPEYPSTFVPEQQGGGRTPHDEYYLRLRANGFEKEIRWNDSSFSAESDARALREWFAKLSTLIYEKPEYKALPEPQGGYL